ncbi:MAG: hypothetical protein GX102_13670 [Porphyromonadaceae bacterium]|nr:hypothetical protein [Porphyromonadaceae bacterium]
MKGIDKIYHLVAGFIISLIFGFINPILGLALAIIAGVGKEIYDKTIKKSVIDPISARVETTVNSSVSDRFEHFSS